MLIFWISFSSFDSSIIACFLEDLLCVSWTWWWLSAPSLLWLLKIFSSSDLFSSSSINELLSFLSSDDDTIWLYEFLLFRSAWDWSCFSSNENSILLFILPELFTWLLLPFRSGDACWNCTWRECWTSPSIRFRCWKAAFTFGFRPWLARVGGMKLFTCCAWYWYCCYEILVNYCRWLEVKLPRMSPPCSDMF